MTRQQRRIRIQAGDLQTQAVLNESPTAERIWNALPLRGRGNRWGEEIYFPIPIESPLEPAARDEMKVGELAYWPPGSAFCIFFGPTPASAGSEPRAASAVNPVGWIEGEPSRFTAVPDGFPVLLEKA